MFPFPPWPRNALTTLFILAHFSQCLLAQSFTLNQSSHGIRAVMAFGDSIFDTGNNNIFQTQSKANFPPYGRDFYGGVATGRFSNGILPPDYIVSKLGIKQLLPPYLTTKFDPLEYITGLCFASAGAGYDPLTSIIMQALPLPKQLELFKDYKVKLEEIAGIDGSATIISDSLFIISSGSVDFLITYFNTRPARRTQYDVPSYVSLLMGYATTFLQELYSLGARKIAVCGVGSIGCTPGMKVLDGQGVSGNCVSEPNQAAMLYNIELNRELSRLNSALKDAKLIYIDTYTPLLNLVQHPFDYGFEISSKGCCGYIDLDSGLTCQAGTIACGNASKYVFWDYTHPTERAYSFIVSQIIEKISTSFS